MSPEQINGLINAWLWLVDAIDRYGPGLAVAAIAWAAWRALRKIRGLIRRRWHRGPHDVGPDALRLLEDLDHHLDELVATDPDLAAGFERLRNAARDEQQKGETP